MDTLTQVDTLTRMDTLTRAADTAFRAGLHLRVAVFLTAVTQSRCAPLHVNIICGSILVFTTVWFHV